MCLTCSSTSRVVVILNLIMIVRNSPLKWEKTLNHLTFVYIYFRPQMLFYVRLNFRDVFYIVPVVGLSEGVVSRCVMMFFYQPLRKLACIHML